MKAKDLLQEVENTKDLEQSKGPASVVKGDPFYSEARDKAMNDYLDDVGPISKYINQKMDDLAKEHDNKNK